VNLGIDLNQFCRLRNANKHGLVPFLVYKLIFMDIC